MLTTGNWLAIISIIVAIVIGLFLKSKNKETNKSINQNSGAFSKGNQTINIKNSQNDSEK